MSLTKDLRQWRKDRNITNADTKVYVANVIEELLEIYCDDKKTIEYLQEQIMDKYFDFDNELLNKDVALDAIQDIQVFSVNETELMRYDNEKCNKEVYKHINSRRQDPIQKIEWQNNGASEKWLKDRSQPQEEIYQPKYEDCKL